MNIAAGGVIDPLPSASALPALAAPSAGEDTLQVASNGELVLPKPIFYKTGSDALLPESEPILQRVVEFMRARPDVRLVRVEVHTDSMGAAQYNLLLSQKRATAVGRWLVDHGADCTRLDAVGYGQTRPIAPNVTDEGRAKNRRTVFAIGAGPASHPLC